MKNINKTNYDEIAYTFSKIIKLKHQPKAATEDNPVQYTDDIIVEIKIEMALWYHPLELCLTQEPYPPSY
jgi:hypothetical protein